ncbi:MAG: RNA polymerase sigma-70 factor [Candidatus Pseudobacter hemicellulosilyticus]|uniref:RNA polymerase sigma-70 factor n=1 Tax=Candidatus Pseudobacter hemicellulosilyticus TaxID=3121375 RepID=A0AAJ5WQP0_9BACT|nr:MAG: RNA polymerase sigma-70 factor [Pseudobacter sp.]
MKVPTEIDLLRRISEDDRRAFRDLYQRYTPELYSFVKSLCSDEALCQDIVQEIFIKLWDNRARATDIQQVKAYLFKAAKNRFLNELRRLKIQRKVAKNKMFSEIDTETPERQLSYKETVRLSEEVLSKLSPKRKLIVEMSTYQDLSLDEIVARVGISKNVVKKLLYQGLATMRKDELLNRIGCLAIVSSLLLMA